MTQENNILTPIDSDGKEITSDDVNILDVKAFIEAEAAKEKTKKPSKPRAKRTTTPRAKKKAKTENAPDIDKPVSKKDIEKGNVNLTLGGSGPVIEESTAVKDRLVDMHINAKDGRMDVTASDKRMYLKAIMNDSPVVLPIKFANGVTITVRDPSMYELDVLQDSLLRYVGLTKIVVPEQVEAIAQQLRVSIMVESVGTKKFHPVRLEPTFNATKREEQIDQIMDAVAKNLNMQGATFSMCIRAINMFNSKVSLMRNAANDGDFWNPLSTED